MLVDIRKRIVVLVVGWWWPGRGANTILAWAEVIHQSAQLQRGGGHEPSRGGGSIPAHHPHQPGRCTAQNLITILITTQRCPHTIHTCTYLHILHVSTSTRVIIHTAPTLWCLTSAARGLAPPCQRGSGLRAEIEKLSAAGCMWCGWCCCWCRCRGCDWTAAAPGNNFMQMSPPLPRPARPSQQASFSKSNFPWWPERWLLAATIRW